MHPEPLTSQEHSDSEQLKNLIFLSNEIAEVKDLDVLMERVLASAREFVDCDAGSIYIVEDNRLQFSYAQNDTLARRLGSGEKLIYTAFTVPITNDSIAGHVALTGEMLNIPDAYRLPGDTPYSFDRSFDQNTSYRTHSILTIPLTTITDRITGVLQLINARDGNGGFKPFERSLEPFVKYLANSAATALERARLMRQTLLRMISMAELRDPRETGSHVNRVGSYAVEIYEALALSQRVDQREIDRNRDILRMAAMLHDVGKVAIADAILRKPGRLTDEEYDTMKMHTVLGARLFRNASSELDIASREVALTHHERFDGRGYPGHVDIMTGEPIPGKMTGDGRPRPRHGEDIPLFGRIVALADVYDALSCARSYKEAWDEQRVLALIEENRGSQFDPTVVDAFFSCLPTIQSLKTWYPCGV